MFLKSKHDRCVGNIPQVTPDDFRNQMEKENNAIFDGYICEEISENRWIVYDVKKTEQVEFKYENGEWIFL